MRPLSWFTFGGLLLSALACAVGKGKDPDSTTTSSSSSSSTSATDDSGTTTTPTTTGDSTASTSNDTDHCDWPDEGICFQYDNYANTKSWCKNIGEKYGGNAVYGNGTCDAGEVLGCDVAKGGDFDHDVTMYYYGPKFSKKSAQSACTDAGGTPI